MIPIPRDRRFINITGKHFGKWAVLEYAGRPDGKHDVWKCRCECSLEKCVYGDHLKGGKSKACKVCAGILCATNLKHGMARTGKKTREFRSWFSAKQRCFNQNDDDFHNYGGRGIKMCSGWLNNFAAFYAELGSCPKGHTIDRNNTNGHYSFGKCEECVANGWPLNCEWSNSIEQGNNRRNNHILEFNGQRKTATEWARLVGLPDSLILVRINRLGWDVAKAITTPLCGRCHIAPSCFQHPSST